MRATGIFFLFFVTATISLLGLQNDFWRSDTQEIVRFQESSNEDHEFSNAVFHHWDADIASIDWLSFSNTSERILNLDSSSHLNHYFKVSQATELLSRSSPSAYQGHLLLSDGIKRLLFPFHSYW